MSSLHSEAYRVLIERIRIARRTVDITQIQLADNLGVDQSFVSKYERGERRLDVVELRRICIALGIDFLEFLAEFNQELQQQGLE